MTPAAGEEGINATVTAVDRQCHRPGQLARLVWLGSDCAIGRSRAGPSTKIHAVVYQGGLPAKLHITHGQTSDTIAAPVPLDALSH